MKSQKIVKTVKIAVQNANFALGIKAIALLVIMDSLLLMEIVYLIALQERQLKFQQKYAQIVMNPA